MGCFTGVNLTETITTTEFHTHTTRAQATEQPQGRIAWTGVERLGHMVHHHMEARRQLGDHIRQAPGVGMNLHMPAHGKKAVPVGVLTRPIRQIMATTREVQAHTAYPQSVHGSKLMWRCLGGNDSHAYQSVGVSGQGR